MSECSHDCGSCSANYESRTVDKSELLEALNPASSVKKMIGVVSGRGGAGKSLVTSVVAMSMNREGKKTAILDADITGPSIPTAFDLPNDGVMIPSDNKLTLPARSMEGVEIISANLLLNKDMDPMVWRGPVITGAVEQFWSETLWQDIDYMFVDMPPGTGDIPLTVFQSLPVDGIIIVTSPQELVSMTVTKTVNMAKKADILIVGVVENMSYLEYPDYGKRINVFGEGHVEEITEEYDIQVLAQVPIGPKVAQMVDAGCMEYMEMPWFERAAKVVGAL